MKTVVTFLIRARLALLRRLWQVFGHLYVDSVGVKRAGRLHFYGLPIISMRPGSRIEVGPRTVFCSDSRFTDLGVAKPVILRTLSATAYIRIGADVGMSGTVICAQRSVEVGNECLFGADVQIVDTDFHPLAAERRRFENDPARIGTAPVVIEDNVFLGAGVKVMKGVRIGRNSVIGAGSVVVHDIPGNVIAAGVPARVIRPL